MPIWLWLVWRNSIVATWGPRRFGARRPATGQRRQVVLEVSRRTVAIERFGALRHVG
jgi:hypothetical protein